MSWLFGVVQFVVLDSTAYPPVWVGAGLGALTLVAHLAAAFGVEPATALSPSRFPTRGSTVVS